MNQADWFVLATQALATLLGLWIMADGALVPGLIVVILGFGGLYNIFRRMIDER